MRRLQQLSIYYKVNGLIVGLLLMLGLLVWLILRQATLDFLGHQMEKRAVDVANYIAVQSANDIVLDNNYALYERISNAQNNTEDVRYILITDYTGKVLVHTFQEGIPKGLTVLAGEGIKTGEPYRLVRFDSNEGTIYEAMVPIENGHIGYVRVGMSDKSTQLFLNRKNAGILLSIALVCLGAIIIATWFTSANLRPVRSLADAAAEIRKGNLAARVDAKTGDEIGLLAMAFNEMVEGLKQKESQNNRLLEELRQKEEMRAVLINKLFTIQEEERLRISRELHDGAGQSLTSLLAYLKVLLSQTPDEGRREILLKLRDIAGELLVEVKNMALELRPPVLDDHGIVAAMERHINNFTTQYQIAVKLVAPSERLDISNEVSLALYRILQEGLTNVVKHAEATAVEVVLAASKDSVSLSIHDNGCGMAPGTLEMGRDNNHLGLYGMLERVELLGGDFEIVSDAGQGTTLVARLPARLEGRNEQDQNNPSR